MPVLNVGDVARVCGGRAVGTARATGIGADSRLVRPGEAFCAVRGGHAFVADALSRGAAFAIVDRDDALPPGAPGVVVSDTVAALGALASDARRRLRVRVVAITGSTGKTVTKDLTAAALRAAHRVHASPGNYNTEIGLPLTLLACDRDAEILVVELGARRTGEIAELAALAQPEIGVITGIGVAHIEIFGSREAIARAKSELLAALPSSGAAVVPTADDFLHVLSGSTRARLVTVGPGGRIRATGAALEPDGRTRVAVEVGGSRVELVVPVPGRALVRDALLALATAVELDVPAAAAADAIGRAVPTGRRMEVVRAGERLVVNDAYNANPTSVAAALRTLRELAGEREAWALLAPMAELGPLSDAAHRRVGRLADTLGVRVIGVGHGYPGADVVGSPEAAAERFAMHAPSDAVVLVKGSRVAEMERAVAALLSRATAEEVRR